MKIRKEISKIRMGNKLALFRKIEIITPTTLAISLLLAFAFLVTGVVINGTS